MSGGSAGARRVSAAYVLLTLALLGVAGWCLLTRASAPGDGTTINLGDNALAADRVTVVDGPPPLRAGDEVVAIDGTVLSERVSAAPGGPPARTDDASVYRVLRDGHLLDLTVTTRPYPWLAALADSWPTLAVGCLVAATAGAIFWFRPREPAARAALLATGLTAVTTAGAAFFPLQALDLVAGTQFWRWWLGEAAFALLWSAMLHFALAFPSPPDWRHYRRWVTLAYLGSPLLYAAFTAGAMLWLDSPTAVLAVVGSPAVPALFVYPVLIVAVLAARYLTSTDPAVRRKLRRTAVALGAGAVVYLAVWVLPTALAGEPLLPQRFHALAFSAVPVAVGLAVLRHRALDIEVVISRSVVYGALSAGVVGTYVAVVAGLALLFPSVDQVWQQAVAAACVALAAQPLRNRLQGLVNKRFFGYTDDPYRVVSTLAARLADTDVPEDLLPGIVEKVAQALRLPHVAIEIDAGGQAETAARVGTPGPDDTELPLLFHGERVGALVVGGRAVLRRRDRAALAELARHAGTAVYTARLTRDLRRSRDRLVCARAEERRRLLHELHDGVGPTLAAVSLGLDACVRGLDREGTTGVLLVRLRDELHGAIAEIRRLAHGLRPPVLDRIGLVPAIREYAGALASRSARIPDGGVSIMLEVPVALPDLPASVDVAAYRIVCEALTNVTRHARASSCAVRLWVDDDLHIEVVDDGVGLARRAAGIGLVSMRQRAAELGGDCLVAAEDRGGTRVLATLPLPREKV
ncbi:sensor histidine kinase [Actinokineospora enzanensis]|uniref:sensor histidine kinase n=1 Tax=Actinokineospora enzanensis TaxID=155975 RepID=UPI00037E7E27|nr:sensor histidine kinase [Actinokineospora enzanensis]